MLSVPIKSTPLINLIGTKLQYKFIRKKKISQFTQDFNVQMLQKIVCNPGNKNTIKTGKLFFFVFFLKATFAQKPAAREVDDGRAKEESEKKSPQHSVATDTRCAEAQTHVCV